jgi:glycerophosphoryl diester phosphodiesterase/arylsulfatase A-like enzyme
MGVEPPRARLLLARWAALVAFLAASSVVIRALVYVATSPFPVDPRYILGCVEGAGVDALLASLVAAPILVGVRTGVASIPLATLFLLGSAAGAHYHAMFQRLPARSTLAYLRELHALGSSIRAHTPLWLLALESLLPALLGFVVARQVAPRLARALPAGRRAGGLGLLLAAAVLGSLARAKRAQGQEYYGAIGPWIHVLRVEAEPSLAPPPGPPRANGHGRDLVAGLLTAIGSGNAGPALDPAFPFCMRPRPAQGSPTGRSVILLILESVDARSLALEIEGKRVMPNLARIAADGVAHPHFFATGHQSAHAMTALFAGIPATPFRALLQHAPLAHVQGFPRVLRDAGYLTAYLHGSDLSFEQQREFLGQIGFDRIVEPSPLSDAPRYGWGLPDGVLLGQLSLLVDEQRRAHPEQPYLASAFTVSTHDPYELPPEHQRRFRGGTEFVRFAESLDYLDGELGRFYEWFRREELPRGTLLVVTGDHAPRVPFPGDPADASTGEFEYRFQVPFLVVGLDAETRARAQSAADGLAGGQQDVPATLLAALGLPPLPCEQGRSLLDGGVPSQRFVPSVAGETLEFVYAHEARRRFMLTLGSGRLVEFDLESDPTLRHDLAPGDPRSADVRRLLTDYLGVMRYAVENDRFAPSNAPARVAPSLPRVDRPRFAAHRALTRGSGGPPGNTLAAIDQALKDDAEWAEIDLNLTADGVPVVHHDPTVLRPGGASATLDSMTLAELRALPSGAAIPTLEEVLRKFAGRIGFCLELKAETRVSSMLSLARATLKVLERMPKESRIVIDSFDHMMLATVRRFSSWQIGYDLPQKPVKAEWLDFAAERGFDWVYIRFDVATEDAVRAAHQRGLRVMVYPPARPSDVAGLAAERPDAIMTEDLAAFAAWRK